MKRDLSALQYNVTENKIKRVIVDTDAACEADDPFAIAHALLSKKLDVRAILAEQFGSAGTVQKSYEEVLRILEAMDMSVPVYMGEDGPLSVCEGKELSEAAEFLIEEAMRDDSKPLYVLCLGALTNVAAAVKKEPAILKRMTVVWIGGHSYDCVVPEFREFNGGNDVEAANLILGSGVELWQIPSNVYGSVHIGLAEIQRRIYPCGAIGKHLFENMVSYNESEMAGWTAGESWTLGDSPAVAVVLEPKCGTYMYREAPVLLADTSYEFREGRPMVKVYTTINSRYILEDFVCKLELMYGDLTPVSSR